MLLYLVNPANPLVSTSLDRNSYWNRFRLWKPLGLLTLAGLTPAEWEVAILDENLAPIDFEALPRPDLVGITAFTSQAPRAYEIARCFRARRVPVVMGGIHATVCLAEASRYADSIVTGEAEAVWAEVLQDVRAGRLKATYDGGLATMDQIVPARHDLLPLGYGFGSIQTTRGCSLNCAFCSVTRFNGARYRQRPIAAVVEEFRSVPEKRVLIVDDNLIGRRPEHIERAKELFRALARAEIGKSWMGQTTVNFADDEELLALARAAGCMGLFIGFESVIPESLPELGKKAAMLSGRDIPASVERIRRHNILVAGSFIMGLDSDHPGVGRSIAQAATQYGIDNMNVLFLTPLPGTRLWEQFTADGRIDAGTFPEDWKYYTLTYPVARYKHLSRDQIIMEMTECNRKFYSVTSVLARLGRNLPVRCKPLYSLVSSLSSRTNSMRLARVYKDMWQTDGLSYEIESLDERRFNLVTIWETGIEQLRRLGATLMARVAWFLR